MWLSTLRHVCEPLPAAAQALDGMEEALATLTREMAALSGRPPQPVAAPTTLTPLGGLSILTLDDDPNMREGMSALLTQLGARVRSVATVTAALRWFMDDKPDVIISDLRIDGEEGASFLREARALPSNRTHPVPAIALTGAASEADREASRRAGFDIHLVKPPVLDELLAAVRTLSTSQR